MRTANNNSNFTVEALVAKYRNYVNDNASVKGDPLFDKEIEKYADHQLLITLYKNIRGDKADAYIMEGLSAYAKAFMKECMSKNEIAFLSHNFKETVDYIFSDKFSGMNWLDWDTITNHKPDKFFIDAIDNVIRASEGDTVFVEDDILGDVAIKFPQCTIVLEENVSDTISEIFHDSQVKESKEENSLKMIRFFAHDIRFKVVKELKDEKMDIVIRNIASGSRKNHDYLTVSSSLTLNGQMLLCVHSEQLVGKDWQSFRDQSFSSRKINAIIKYGYDRFIMIADNKEHTSICMRDEMSDLRKDILYSQIETDILLTGFYLNEKPTNWIPFSMIVDILNIPRIDVPTNNRIPNTSKVLLQKGLGISFKDADIRKRDLYSVSDLLDGSTQWGGGMDFSGWYSNSIPCVYLWGFEKEYRIGYVSDNKVVYAVPYQMSTLIPKKGIDIRYVAALLFLPEVQKQIESLYCGDHIVPNMPTILKHIYVPNHTEMERTAFLSETNYSALEDFACDQKKAHEVYVKAIRLRKHALTQSLTSIESMFYALNNYRVKNGGQLHDEDVISRVKGTTVGDAFNFLSKSIEDMMPALEHIAEVEYSFAKPGWIDPEKFVEEYISRNENGWLNFKPVVTWDKGNNQAQKDITNPAGDIILRKGEPICKFLFPKDALERIFRDIISNALAHGFDNPMRKDYLVRFSWHTDGLNFILEIENNGTAIEADRETSSLFEYGVSTKLHKDGHNGIGCNEIADIIHRYDGDIEIVSTPDDEFTVKYILTFSHFIVKTT